MSYLPLQYGESNIFPRKIIAVRPDVHIMFSAGTLPQSMTRATTATSPIFELSYTRKNTLYGEVGRVPMEVREGHTSLGFLGEVSGHSEYERGAEIELYSIWVSPQAFNGFCEAVSGKTGIGFGSFMQGAYSHHDFKSDAREENLKRKLEACFTVGTGSFNRLLVESYLLELLSINIERLIGTNEAGQKLSRADREHMAAAREILLDRLAAPPSLFELSRTLHMNDCKLKRLFKQCYGTTVYGFIRDQRLEKAFSLLEQGEHNVSEAAFAVGYTNASHFSEAFQRKFGFMPSAMI